MLQRLFDCRLACLGVVQEGSGLLDIKRADLTGLEFRSRDSNAFGLIIQVLLCHIKLFLGGSDDEISLGDLCDQRQHDTVVAGNAGIERCGCRFDLPFETTPDVGLPAQVEPQIVERKSVFQQRKIIAGIVAQLFRRHRTGQLLLLRILAPDGNRQLLTCLQHPQPGRT